MTHTKRILSLFLAAVLLLSALPLTASAAMAWPVLSETNYAEYTVPGRLNVYADANLNKRGTQSPYREYNAYVDPGDVIRIYSINETSCKIRYPVGNSQFRIGYAKTSTLFGCTAPMQYTARSKAKVTTYTNLGQTTSGFTAVNDEVYRLGSSNGGRYILIGYTAKNSSGRGWKIAFVKTTDYACITGSPTDDEVTSFYAYVKTRNPNYSLKLRSGPATTASVLLNLPYGTRVTVCSIHNTWAKITVNGKTGYASVQYLSGTKPSPTVSVTEDDVKYVYKTVTLDTTNLSTITASLLKAQDQADGIIVSQNVNEYRTIAVTEPTHGPTINGKTPTKVTTIRVPYRVTFKIHTHERVKGYGASFRYANGCIITSYTCKCGYSYDLTVWEIPLPDPSEFAYNQITETIRIQSQKYVWFNNIK